MTKADPKVTKERQPTDPKVEKHATAVQVQQRVDTIFSLLIGGSRHAEILRYAAEKTDWNVAPRTVEAYITKANQQFPRISKFRHDMELGKAIARLNSMYRRTTAAGDIRTALQVQKVLNELLGLNAPIKMAHEGQSGSPAILLAHMTDEEVEERVRQIFAKRNK
jgi:hypothetical protein